LTSHDGGVTWDKQDSPEASWLTSILFIKPGNGWIASDQDFLLSTDGGKTWRSQDVPSNIFPLRLVPVGGDIWALGEFGALRATGQQWEPVSLGGSASAAGN
jgi:photosystem II stability/assembly factor-like uncharacterized protein